MKKIAKTIKRKRGKKIQKGAIGNIFIFGILLLLIVLSFSLVGGSPSTSTPENGTLVQITTPTPNATHNTLQLETFGYTTIAPTLTVAQPSISSAQPINSQPSTGAATPPSDEHPVPDGPPAPANSFPTAPPNAPVCQDQDDGVIVPDTCRCADLTVVCSNGNPVNITPGQFGSLPVDGLITCGAPPYAENGRYCVGKPVIYLYPTDPTFVTVQVNTIGSIVESNPTYPQGGWKNVLAYPNGNLEYQNQPYTELFYESSVNSLQKPEKGIVIPKDELTENLNSVLDKLGLISNEKKEFIAFWLPKLQALNSPYIFFSVLSSSSKDTVDHVVITPKPDTQIAFIAYFKPVNTANYGSALELPPTPQRIGFTSVEWGGVIDK
jgi:hypothetical protein